MIDLVIRGGTIVDGTGRPSFRGDVGIEGDRITTIGNLEGVQAAVEIDAAGQVVAPGFIDMHTHSDFTLLVNGAAESQIHQGVTLEAVGNCGHSCAPVGDPDVIKRAIFGYSPHVDITWRTFADYLERLEQADLGINTVAYVGHGAIRLAVLRGEQRPATQDEQGEMEILADEALEAGAIGLSSGLEYSPGNSARTEEVLALCHVAKRHDALYATHVRNRDYFYEQGFGEALGVARRTGVKLQISHITPKFGAPPHAMEHTLDMVHWTRKAGVDVAFDMIPHDWGPTSMSAVLPPWAFEGGVKKVLERLGDPVMREKIKQNPLPIWKLVQAGKWDHIMLFESAQNRDLIGLTFEEIGRERRVDPYDAVLDILLEEGEGLYGVTWVGHLISEDDLKMTLHEPECAAISDTITLAPYGALENTKWSPSTYGWTARLFQRFVREQPVLSLEDAVYRLTGLPASRLGLKERGYLHPGAFADVTVFNPATVTDTSTLKEPNRYPTGINHVLVNGQAAILNGQRANSNAGRVLRRT